MPSEKWHWNQYGFNASFVRDSSEKFLVGVDARTTAFIGHRLRFPPLQRSCDGLRHIFHKGRLQSRQAAAEHWIEGKPTEKLENEREKRVIRSEHHRWTDENCIGKRRSDCQFAFTTLADIERGRCSIGADS